MDRVQIDDGFVRDSETAMSRVDRLVPPSAVLDGCSNEPLPSGPGVAVVDADQPEGDLTEDDLARPSLVGLFHDRLGFLPAGLTRRFVGARRSCVLDATLSPSRSCTAAPGTGRRNGIPRTSGWSPTSRLLRCCAGVH